MEPWCKIIWELYIQGHPTWMCSDFNLQTYLWSAKFQGVIYKAWRSHSSGSLRDKRECWKWHEPPFSICYLMRRQIWTTVRDELPLWVSLLCSERWNSQDSVTITPWLSQNFTRIPNPFHWVKHWCCVSFLWEETYKRFSNLKDFSPEITEECFWFTRHAENTSQRLQIGITVDNPDKQPHEELQHYLWKNASIIFPSPTSDISSHHSAISLQQDKGDGKEGCSERSHLSSPVPVRCDGAWIS